MKYSKQREALLRVLKNTRSHPSADWLYDELRAEFPSISLGTVYRNLALLADNGAIKRITTGSGKEHFDGFTDEHSHFVCTECDSIYDITLSGAEKLNEEVEKSLSATVDNHSLVFYGLCSKCKKRV